MTAGYLKYFMGGTFLGFILTTTFAVQVWPEENAILVASTTSTVNSGLFDELLPVFRRSTGISVRVVGVGTGQAIEIAKRGDADILLVHHERSEIDFVKDGFGIRRHPVMYNDFVLVGPRSDPAGIRIADSVISAYRMIGSARSVFVSRGDESGTHKRSQEFWKEAMSDQAALQEGSWFNEVGAGMGATLNIAQEMEGYTLTDRGTWEAFRNKGSLEILFEGDPSMYNPYSVIMVNQQLHKHVRSDLATIFIQWLTSREGQELIENYKINGKQIFYPKAIH
ncbi:MAG: substrate-binding domain-containing protein [Pseudomonadota bacterium]|nr:substrate-binding domain-containing protein [Pseudomonadota bacterium]